MTQAHEGQASQLSKMQAVSDSIVGRCIEYVTSNYKAYTKSKFIKVKELGFCSNGRFSILSS